MSSAAAKKKPQRTVVDYRMSSHFGLCLGPADALLEIRIKDKIAWPSTRVDLEDEDFVMPEINGLMEALNSTTEKLPSAWSARGDIATAAAALPIHEMELFGGDQSAGGVSGVAVWLPGHDDQVLPEDCAVRFGLTPDTAPGFRGVATLMFLGSREPQSRPIDIGPLLAHDVSYMRPVRGTGFLWSINDPFLPNVSARVLRRPRAFEIVDALPSNAAYNERQVLMIQREEGMIPDANPAAVIWEILTSNALGIRIPPRRLDLASFVRAARVLSREKCGFSHQWTDQAEGRSYLSRVLDHMAGGITFDQKTGRYGIRLLRSDADLRLYKTTGAADEGDYAPDATSLYRGDLAITQQTADLVSASRRSWSDMISTMDVTFVDATTGESTGVTAHDNAAIAVQGGGGSGEREFPGARNEALAFELAARELRNASWPVLNAEVRMGRNALDVKLYDVIPMIWPEEEIETLVRVIEIDYGKTSDQRIRLTVIEDMLGGGSMTAQSSGGRAWGRGSAIKEIWQGYVTTAPYPWLVSSGVPAEEIEAMEDGEEGLAMHFINAAQPATRHEVFKRSARNLATGEIQSVGVVPDSPCTFLEAGWPAEEFTMVNLFNMDWGVSPQDIKAGDFLVAVRDPGDGWVRKRDPIKGGELSEYEQVATINVSSTRSRRLSGDVITGSVLDAVGEIGGNGFVPGDPFLNVLALTSATLFEGASWTGDEQNSHYTYDRISGWYPEEWIRIDSIDKITGEAVLRRGLYDTTPAPLRAGDRIYHLPKGAALAFSDPLDATYGRAGNEYYAYQPYASDRASRYIFGYASFDADCRLQRPLRPANVNLAVTGSADDGYAETARGKVTLTALPQTVRVSFSSRNRDLEDAGGHAWTEGGSTGGPSHFVRVWRRIKIRTPAIAPATGQPWGEVELVEKINLDPASNYEVDIPIATFDLTEADDPRNDLNDRVSYVIEIGAVQGDYESIQNPLVGLEIRTQLAGYGAGYGQRYGAR